MDRFDRDIGFPKKSRIYLLNQKRKKSGGYSVDEDFYGQLGVQATMDKSLDLELNRS